MGNDLDKLRQLQRQVEQQLQGPQSFGRRLRQLRNQHCMTLDALATESDISKTYLSQIENGRVDPPRDEKIRRLEEVFDLRPGTLLELAHLARTPEDVRSRLEQLQSAFQRSEQALSTLMERMPDAPPSAAESPSPQTRVPIINRVAAGQPSEFTDLDYPPGVADEYIGAIPGLEDPQAFAVRVEGDSMEPRYHQGDIVIFSPTAPVAGGDDCYVRFAAECSVAQGATFKRVYFDGSATVRLQPLNGRYPPLVVPQEEITGIYKAAFRYETL